MKKLISEQELSKLRMDIFKHAFKMQIGEIIDISKHPKYDQVVEIVKEYIRKEVFGKKFTLELSSDYTKFRKIN